MHEPAIVGLLFDPFRTGLIPRVFALPDDRAAAGAELGRLLASFGFTSVEASPSGESRLVLPDGRIAQLLAAKALAHRPSRALVVRSGSTAVAAYLVADDAAALSLAEELASNGQDLSISDLEQVPPDAPDDAPTLRFVPLLSTQVPSVLELIMKLGVAGAIHDFGDEFCPRCQDQPLSRDPAHDVRDADGRRICLACARFARREL
jgi:hypothetical protein